MPKVTAATAALIAVLALAGCASGGTSDDASAERSSTTSESNAEQNSSEDETPAPLTAETSEPEGPEALFVQEARDRLDGLGAASTIPSATDEQLITGGRDACEALTAGTPFDDVTVIEGEERVQGSYLDSAAITTAAVLFFCPELNGNLS